VKGGVKFDANDRFCLDGQRLVAVNGVYGANGTEYRTEIESFARIISNGTAGTGPASFTVQSKDGKTMEYGVTVDSRIEAQGKTSAMNWALNKISDRQGNEVTFSYIEDNAAGHYRINRMDYAGNSVMGTAPKASVRFVYATRTDNKTGYIAGSKYSIPVRMTNVQTYITSAATDVLVRDYRLVYQYSASTGRSRLLSSTEYDVSGASKPTISFAWTTSFSEFTFSNNVAGYSPAQGYTDGNAFPIFTGDWNGDGKMDFARVHGTGIHFFNSTGSGFVFSNNVAGYSPAQGYTDGNAFPIFTGDWNGDGKTDFARVHGTGIHFLISTGSGFVFSNNVAGYSPAQGYTDGNAFPIFTGDWNGDGKTDFARVHGTGIHFLNGTGSGFVFSNNVAGYSPAQGYTDGNAFPIFTGDWNGDGKTDFTRVHGTGIHFLNRKGDVSPDQLLSVTNSLGAKTSFIYKPITDNTVYTKGTGAVNPVRDYQAAIYVVSSASMDDGVGGQRVTDYTYGGMKIDVSGRGNLGFAWMESTDVAGGITSRTTFNQTWPYVGRAMVSERKLSNGTLIARSSSTWSNLYGAGSVFAPYSSLITKDSFEINDGLNAPVTSVTTTRGYNTVFTPTVLPASYQETVTEIFSDGHQRTAVSTMINDVGNWIIGQLSSATVTNAQPGGAQRSRTSSFNYYPMGLGKDGLLQSEIIEPGSADPMQTLTTTYNYDGFGNRISSTVTGNSKNAAGAIVTQSRSTTVTYDAQGQFPLTTTNAAGHTESYVWDARFGVKTSLTGPNGLTTTWAYDNRGRKTGENRADGTTSTITYGMDVAPFYVTTQSTGSPAKSVSYDKLGRKILVEGRGFGRIIVNVDTEYNALGQVFRKSNPYQPRMFAGGVGTQPRVWTTYSYDAVGRVLTTTKPDGTVMSSAYNGLTTTVTNALNQTRTEIKDVRGRVSQVVDSMNGTLTYSYDPFGNLSATTDVAGHVVSMSYDLRGRKIGMNDPDMGIWSYAYSAFGELISQSNARGQTTTMSYDNLGRMISRVEVEGASTWTYDAGVKGIGKLTSESAPGAYAKVYSYDGFGRPLNTTTTVAGNNYVMATSYDLNGRVNTITYPTGFAIKRIYNAQGYLSEIQNAANAMEVFWKANAVDENGHVLQETLGDGLVTTRQYNPLTGRLESIAAGLNGSIQNLSMAYDALGNLQSRSDGILNWTESFSYDALNRITGVTGPASKTYAYDAIGNITNKSDVGAYIYGDLAHVHAVTQAGGNSYTYDANGNMLSGAGRTLSWTSFDRPASISTASAYTSMEYDANHKRIMKSTALGETTVYIGGAFEEVRLAGITKAKHYIRSGNGLIAIMEQVGTVKLMKYVHNDQLGSINVITDGTGAVLERLSFDAFGKPRNANATDAASPVISTQTTRGYTGHKMDAEVGLINMNARLYDPVLGRFISADVTIDAPQDMQTYNRYTYVMNNPFAYTDPSGNWGWKNFFKAVAKPIRTTSHFVYRKVLPVLDKTLGARTANYLLTKYKWIRDVAGIVSGFNPWTSAAYSAHMTRVYGGSDRQISQAFVRSIIISRLSAEVNGAYGKSYSVDRVIVSGVVGGVSSQIQGGEFSNGFYRGAVMSAISWGGQSIYKSMSNGYYANTDKGSGVYKSAEGDTAYPTGKGLTVDISKKYIGGKNENLTGNFWADLGKQGSRDMRVLEMVPGFHAVSILHDQMMWNQDSIGVVQMIPAAIITYAALADRNSAPVLY